MYSETDACTPLPLNLKAFNSKTELPYGLKTSHIRRAMGDFVDFLGFVNTRLDTRGIQRLESMLMPANFSSIVGEFMTSTIPKYCKSIAKNRYHNGHPDMVPAGMFENDAAQHSQHGVEVKASRYLKAWQGHNPEDIFLMVFVFDSNRPKDTTPRPFRFAMVLGARLTKKDWRYSGRSATSRRTITASVTDSGYRKMISNWIYQDDSGADQVEHGELPLFDIQH